MDLRRWGFFLSVLCVLTIFAAGAWAQTEQTEHTITASAGKGGIINPSGLIKVKDKGSQIFDILAAKGYVIMDVQVDGKPQQGVFGTTKFTYNFSEVAADHRISAFFVPFSKDSAIFPTDAKKWTLRQLAADPMGLVPVTISVSFTLSSPLLEEPFIFTQGFRLLTGMELYLNNELISWATAPRPEADATAAAYRYKVVLSGKVYASDMTRARISGVQWMTAEGLKEANLPVEGILLRKMYGYTPAPDPSYNPSPAPSSGGGGGGCDAGMGFAAAGLALLALPLWRRR